MGMRVKKPGGTSRAFDPILGHEIEVGYVSGICRNKNNH
jgi:hypothetical protein